MNMNDIEFILKKSSEITNHRHFVIAGSLSIIGAVVFPPEDMVNSVDVDLYPKFDPNRSSDIAQLIGEGSDFHLKNKMYADAITPSVLSLPDGWNERLLQFPFDTGSTAWFLDPNDAAISKCIRGLPRDASWIESGLKSGVLDIEIMFTRLVYTRNVLDGEIEAGRLLIKSIQDKLNQPIKQPKP